MVASPYRAPQPGYRFRDGKLYAFEKDCAYVMHAWPELEAVQKGPLRPPYGNIAKWHAFEPAFRLVWPYRPAPRPDSTARASWHGVQAEQLGLGLDPPTSPATSTQAPRRAEQLLREEKRRAFAAFRFSMPKEVARLVEPLRGHHWPVLQLLRDFPVAQEIMAANPALIFGLAWERQRMRNGARPWMPRIDHLLVRKQCDIVQYLGLPGTKRAARLLSRVPSNSIYPGTARDLARVLANPAATKLAAHLPSLNVGALQIVASDGCREMATPRLLREVSEQRRESHHPFIYMRMKKLLLAAREIGVDVGRFHSIGAFTRTWREVTDTYREYREAGVRVACGDVPREEWDGCFPPPPVPGTHSIWPLTSPKDLIEEGRIQHNCVGSYAGSVRSRRCYVYRVYGPERATLSVRRDSKGLWVIQHLESARCRQASAATRRLVAAWLFRRQRGKPLEASRQGTLALWDD